MLKIRKPSAMHLILILVFGFSLTGCECVPPEHDALPSPSGLYQVGSLSIDLVDTSREEMLTINPKDPRKLNIRCWYPAEPEDDDEIQAWAAGDEAQVIQEEAVKMLAEMMPELSFLRFFKKLLSPLFCVFGLVATNTFPDAPIFGQESPDPVEPYPVVLFGHGFGGSQNQNTIQMEELASHEYIACSIAHPYESMAVFYTDGEIVRSNWRALKRLSQPSDIFDDLHVSFNPDLPDIERISIIEDFFALEPYIGDRLTQWKEDILFVMDKLDEINDGTIETRLAGRLDLDRIGVFGHSFGGASSASACAADARCKAAINMDGFQYHEDTFKANIGVPFMMLYSEPNARMNDFFYGSESTTHRFTVAGTAHFDYTDTTYLLSNHPFRDVIQGDIDGIRMLEIMNTYVLTFFDLYLKDIETELLNGNSLNFPEVDYHQVFYTP